MNISLVLCLVLALLPIVTTSTLAAAAPNLDSASTWARERIQEAFDKGFIPTDIQGNYTNVITREEFCRMAAKWMEYVTGKSIAEIVAERGVAERLSHTFSDTTDPIILAAYRLGVTNGTTAPTSAVPGVFNPSGAFDRQQAATMIMNVCKALGANVDNPPNSDFIDLNTASSWARDGINFVRANGIMSGTSTTTPTFSPLTNYTREESILTFNNIDPSRVGIGNSNPSTDISVVGIWVLERMEISGAVIPDEELESFFPAGAPYLWFNEDLTITMYSFSVEFDLNNDTIAAIVEDGTFSISGNSITIVSSAGHTIIFSIVGEIITFQTDNMIMHFRNQPVNE